MANNFKYWVDEIADMPEKQNGVWIDLETGLPYDSTIDYATGLKRTSATLSAKAVATAPSRRCSAAGR